MEFIWNDGGRAASGFVGLTGDCVTRAVAIGTGVMYREVYETFGEQALKSPRSGIAVSIPAEYLIARGWQAIAGGDQPFDAIYLPKGLLVVHVSRRDGAGHHMCAVIDHVVHDTWNASENDDYKIVNIWAAPVRTDQPGLSTVGARPTSGGQELNQQAFEKILRRLKALDNTASNSASTEGEKHNALRMMQDLMLRHNLSRDDISDDDNIEAVQFTRRACPLNSRRACTWEVLLAGYITRHIFPMVQYYTSTRGHRTLFWFYGPHTDVDNCIALFQELLLTIASAAVLQYGGYTRGSGASYCEGYVSALPLPGSPTEPDATTATTGVREHAGTEAAIQPVSQQSLIQTRTLALKSAALDWLDEECNVRLVAGRRSGRWQHDPAAKNRGRQHGASHEINAPGAPKRLT